MKKNLDLRGVWLGIGVGLVTILALTALSAWLVSTEHLPAEQAHIAAAGILAAGSLIGSLCCSRGEGRWLRCGAVALGLCLGLMGLNLTFFDGSLSGLLPGVLVVAGGAGAAALTKGEKRPGGRRRKYRPR